MGVLFLCSRINSEGDEEEGEDSQLSSQLLTFFFVISSIIRSIISIYYDPKVFDLRGGVNGTKRNTPTCYDDADAAQTQSTTNTDTF